MFSVAVITPTTGHPHLIKAVTSVNMQKFKGKLTHHIVMDGPHVPHFSAEARAIFERTSELGNYVKLTVLPENTGQGQFYGNRINAAWPFLVNEDIVMYLDQDCWYEPDHVQTVVDAFMANDNACWVNSLRNIVDHDGEHVCQDNCESLGQFYPTWDGQEAFVDTNCIAFRRTDALRYLHKWYGGWGTDRAFSQALNGLYGVSTGKHTVNYRLNHHNSLKDYFVQGNEIMKNQYGGYPWVRT